MLKTAFHVHTDYSDDCNASVESIADSARRAGIGCVAITDHDTIKGSVEAIKNKPAGLDVICGAEIKTDRGDVIGLFLSEEITAVDHLEVIDRIHAQGGIAIVPHPFDSMRGSAFWLTDRDAKRIDAVEVINARCIFKRSNEAANAYADTYRMSKVGGSDAHFGAEIGNAGTLVPEGEDIREAILKKHTMAFGRCSTPLFHVFTTALLMERRVARRRTP